MALFERSVITDRLMQYLRAHDKGQQLTYAQITAATEYKVGPKDHHLRYARTILRRDHAQVWVTVRPGIGIERLTDQKIADRLPSWWLNGARRKLDRGGDESAIVEINNLTIDGQARFSVNSIQQQLALQSLSKPTWRHLEKVARGTSNDLPSFNILEWAFSLTPRRKATE
jgi:hypothetical protein